MAARGPAGGSVSRRGFLQLGGAGLAAAATTSLAACGAGSSSTTTSSGKKQLNFVTSKFESTTSMQDFVQGFNDSQDTYEVVVRELPPPSSSTEVHQQLVQQLGSSGGGVDIFTQDVIWIAEFAAAGWAMKLDDEFSDDEKAAWFPGLVDACTFDGTFSAIPFYLDGGSLYYRSDLLKQNGLDVPTSWEDLATQAKDLMGEGVDIGFSWQAKQAEVLVCDLVEFVGSAGGSILGEDGTTVTIADAPAVEAVQFMYDSMNSLGITPKDVLSWDEEPSRQPFTNGDAAFLRQWSYVYNISQDKAQSEVVGDVGVGPLPAFSGGQSASCLGGYQLGVAEASENKDGALEFVRWMTSIDQQIAYAEQFGSAPALQAAYDDSRLKEAQPTMVQFKDTFLGATGRPVTPKYPQVSLALQSAVSKALTTGDVQGNLDEAKSAIESIVSA